MSLKSKYTVNWFQKKGDELKTFLQLAAKAAAINCTREGATPLYWHEMDVDVCILFNIYKYNLC